MGLFKIKTRSSTNGDSSASTKSSSIKSPVSGKNKMSSSPTASTSTLPDIPIPPPPDATTDPAGYLRSIHAVRQRSRVIYDIAQKNQLKHFDIDHAKFKDTAQYVVSIIKRDFAPDYSSIPPHGRWQHFEVGAVPRIVHLLQKWKSTTDDTERCRRLLDLFLVSVLLDAGAGSKWSYKAEDGRSYNRSEGLAVASLEMFNAGLFSSDAVNPYRVDADGLSQLTVHSVAQAMQVSVSNPMEGLDGRTGLLVRLGDALRNPEYFGADMRPGNMLDYLLAHPTTKHASTPIVTLPTLWSVLMDGLGPIWPASRTQLNGTSLGDAWPCNAIPSSSPLNIVPFHKLSQWLCYSLMVPMTKILSVRFAGADLMTGLAEYRNGGLLIDMGLLTLKAQDHERGVAAYTAHAAESHTASCDVVPLFTPDDDVVVEWRALTVAYLDEMLSEVNTLLKLSGPNKLSLPQMLEAGTWKGGREIAEFSRPSTKGPPIMILSDGTVF